MTTAQATLLQMRWKQKHDSSPDCQHPVEELASSDYQQGHVLNAYHCRDCGALIIHRFKGKSVSDSHVIEPGYFNDL